jgi:hypothetical protein
MEPRTIAFGLIAVIAAFAAAFGIASSGGGGTTATAGPGTKAETIKVAAPAAVAGVEVGGTVPSLKAQPKKHAKKKATKKTATTTPSTTNSTATPQSTPQTPSSTPTARTPTTPSTPSTPSTPRRTTPKPNPTPVSGGGEDG